MKKIIALAMAATLLFSVTGCMVATNETLVVPVTPDEGAPVFMTYYGEAKAPFVFPTLPAGTDVNVIQIDQEGADAWKETLAPEDLDTLRSTLHMDIDKELSAITSAKAFEGFTEEEVLDAAQQGMDSQQEALSDLTDDEKAEVQSMVTDVVGVMAEEIAAMQTEIIEATMMTYGPTYAAYNLTKAPKRLAAHYPNTKINGAYTLIMSDINGIAPKAGKPVNIDIKMPLKEGDKSSQVVIIATNGAIASRQAKIVDGNLCFTVPSTLGTLFLVLEDVPAVAADVIPATELVPATEVAK